MLIKDFYTVNDIYKEGEETIFKVSLNPDCHVYQGHFPGESVAPGVVTIEMIKECAEQVAGKRLNISSITGCRFLKLVTPDTLPAAEVRIHLTLNQPDDWNLVASLGDGEAKYLTLKAVLNG